jgi:outer membrane protein insertion porin family
MLKRRVLILALSLLSWSWAQAFVVQKIEFQGLSRIPASSVMPDVPVKAGQDLTPALSNQVIQDLFATGYFQDIQLYNNNGTLVINVIELPTIASVDFKGNDLIKTDDLKTALTGIGVQVGNMFNQALINQVKQSLVQEYNSQGKYAVKVNVDTKVQPNNRIALTINISEGLYAKIDSINIIGNQVFSEHKLVKQLPLSTGGIIAFFTKSDVYTPEKLSKALQALTNFYQNNGYIDVRVNSAEGSLDSTHTKAFVTISITEGNQYKFAGFDIKGDLILPKPQLLKLVSIKAKKTYSKQVVINGQQAIVDALGDIGYAFVNVNPVPIIDHEKRTVFINYYVTPGQKVYVRDINYSGNVVTNDQTFRERMKLSEGSTYSKTDVDNSTMAIQRLPFIQNVDVSKMPVAGSSNQVDLNYKVKEQSANSVSAAIGYSDLNGVLFQTGFNMPNLFGTGNIFNVNAQISRPYQSVNMGVTNPYFTLSGISQSVNFYFQRTNAGMEGLTNFSTNSFGTTLNYAIPISTWNFFNIGAGIDHTQLQQPGDSESATVTSFINKYGSEYNTYSATVGFSRDSTNNAYFPTQGQVGNVSTTVAAPFSNLNYYKLNASGTAYQALNNIFTLSVSAGAGYGGGYGKNADLPFFQNYYGGGWGNVRGYTAGAMGPSDTNICTDPNSCTVGTQTQGSPLGGNLMLYSSLQLTYPVPFMADNQNLKLITFLDAGNVYNTYQSSTVWQAASQPTSPNFSNLRYTAGVGLEWVIPMLGPVGISFAVPLNKQPGDNTQIFQFTLGTFF